MGKLYKERREELYSRDKCPHHGLKGCNYCPRSCLQALAQLAGTLMCRAQISPSRTCIVGTRQHVTGRLIGEKRRRSTSMQMEGWMGGELERVGRCVKGRKKKREEMGKEQEAWIKESPRWNRKYACQLSLWHMSLPAGTPKDQGEGSWSSATFRPGHANSGLVMPTQGF